MRETEFNGGRFGCFTAGNITCKRSIYSLTIVITSRAVSGSKLVSVLFVDLSDERPFPPDVISCVLNEIYPFPIDNVFWGVCVCVWGGQIPPPPPPPPPPPIHSLWEIDKFHWQRANALKLEISSKYLVQYILDESQGIPTILTNWYTGSDITWKRSILLSPHGYGSVYTCHSTC